MLTAELAEIAAYTARHRELQQAHHWLYDLKCPVGEFPEVAIVGLNPGEWYRDWEICSHQTEETSRFDFHEAYGAGRESIPWTKQCQYFVGGRPFVQTELFFWSSTDSKQLEQRYGRLRASPHLSFCRDLNRRLFDAYNVKAVICAGINNDALCHGPYELGPLRETLSVQGVRVAKLYHDGQRPWLFTKHWTGAFGFSRAQRDRVKWAIEELLV